MLNNKFYILIIMLILSIYGCDSVESNNINNEELNNNNDSENWLIPVNEVFDGGPGKDGIPALTNPKLVGVNSINFLVDEDLVIIVKEGAETRIYPHLILDWHEIINDKIGNLTFAITYCPLTGSGISWDRIVDGEETTFGVSGLLYNTNLIAYDRKTQSNWSQMRLQSVNGAMISNFVKTYPIIETSWKTAKELLPDALVVSTSTGHSRNYGRYPYGSYRTNHSSLIFPVNNSDSRLNAKERVLGVISSDSHKAYSILDFQEIKVFIDTIGNKNFLVYGDERNNLITAFELTDAYSDLTFSKSSLSLPYIIEDNLENHYNIFGESRDASKINLKSAKAFIAYWFAWAAFYPETELYNNN